MNCQRPLIAVVAGAASIALIAACSSSNSKGNHNTGGGSGAAPPPGAGAGSTANVVNPGFNQKGGTVDILSDANFNHLDPVQNYVTNSGEFGKLIYRTLTVIKDTPGQKPTIQPDIAESLGTPSDDDKVWTFHLRHGLKFQDGTPITAADIKYNIERSFATDIYKDGPTYMADTLVNSNHYVGPYKDPNKDLTSVQTPDPFTMVFHFQGPQPDADWMMSEFTTAPVPKAKDDKQNYDFHPVSSGPYMIKNYVPDKTLTLVRNPNWNPASDTYRRALPDQFVVTFGIDLPTISQRLIADQGSDKNAVTLENSGALQNGDLPKVKNAGVKSRFVNGPGPCIDYEFINEQKIKDPDVRKAIAMAINRQAVQTIYGGDLFGSISNTLIPAGIEGSAPPDLGLKPQGDPAAAKALLAGKTVPTIHYGVASTSVKQKTVATQVQNDLKAVGLNVVIDQIPGDSYYSVLRSDNAPDIGRAGWCYDWPTSAAVVPPVLGPDSSGKTWSSNNFSRYYDPTESAKISQLAVSTVGPAAVGKNMNDAFNQIMTTSWPLLPTVAALDPQVVGSNIANAGVSPIFSEIDLVNIGVKH